ncbi:MAG: LytR C-terminal domain-containing protein [Gaiellales bacterium]
MPLGTDQSPESADRAPADESSATSPTPLSAERPAVPGAAFAIRPGRLLLYGVAGLAGVFLAFLLTFIFVAKPIAARSATTKKPPATAETEGKHGTGAAAKGQKLKMAAPAEAELTRGETSVLVMNGSGERGGAQKAAGALEGMRYTVAGFGNAPNQNYRRTIVLYTHGHRGEAERLARDLQLPRRRVSPVDGMHKSELQGAAVVLILGL